MANEDQWIIQASQGDETAWERLVSEHQEAVFRLAYLLLGDPDEAEDIAQEAFVRAYQSLDRFDTTRPLRPWLLRITANLAYNNRRSLSRYLATLTRWVQSEVEAGLDIESQSTQRLDAQSLWDAILKLTPDDQQIIFMRYYLDLPVEETAQALGIAPGTVKSRLHRALTRLRVVVKAYYPALNEEFLS